MFMFRFTPIVGWLTQLHPQLRILSLDSSPSSSFSSSSSHWVSLAQCYGNAEPQNSRFSMVWQVCVPQTSQPMSVSVCVYMCSNCDDRRIRHSWQDRDKCLSSDIWHSSWPDIPIFFFSTGEGERPDTVQQQSAMPFDQPYSWLRCNFLPLVEPSAQHWVQRKRERERERERERGNQSSLEKPCIYGKLIVVVVVVDVYHVSPKIYSIYFLHSQIVRSLIAHLVVFE